METENDQTETVEQIEPTENNGASPITATYFTYEDFSCANMTCSANEQKPIPNTTPPQYYNIIPLYGTYGEENNKIMGDLLFEFCELTAPRGIQEKPNPNGGRIESSMLVNFSPNESSHTKCLDSLNDLYTGCAHILSQYKGAVGLPLFRSDMPDATGLKALVYYPRDKQSGDLIPGKMPSIFLKLVNRSFDKTVFTDCNGTPIDWKLLMNVRMKFIPLAHIKRIYIGGGKASIQMEIVSAIVTHVENRNTTSMQTVTLDKLKRDNPTLCNSVAAQLARLSLERQDKLLQPTTQVQQPTTTEHHDVTTFAGINEEEPKQTTPIPQPKINTPTPATKPAVPIKIGGVPIPAIRTIPKTK